MLWGWIKVPPQHVCVCVSEALQELQSLWRLSLGTATHMKLGNSKYNYTCKRVTDHGKFSPTWNFCYIHSTMKYYLWNYHGNTVHVFACQPCGQCPRKFNLWIILLIHCNGPSAKNYDCKNFLSYGTHEWVATHLQICRRAHECLLTDISQSWVPPSPNSNW